MDFYNKFKTAAAQLSADARFKSFKSGARLLNAALTFCFGYTYGAAFFPTGNAGLSAILGGVAYTLILDAAAYGWDNATKRKGIHPQQRRIAEEMSKHSMWASSGVSLAYVILTTQLVDLSSVHGTISIVALIVTSLLLVDHFLKLFEYDGNSPEALQAKARGEYESALASMYLEHEEQFMLKVAERMNDKMLENIDRFADQKAEQEWKKIAVKMEDKDFKVAASKKSSKTPPSAAGGDPKAAKAEATHAESEDGYVDFEEIKGNAHEARETNLNMAAG